MDRTLYSKGQNVGSPLIRARFTNRPNRVPNASGENIYITTCNDTRGIAETSGQPTHKFRLSLCQATHDLCADVWPSTDEAQTALFKDPVRTAL
jgi:hypothetical protein